MLNEAPSTPSSSLAGLCGLSKGPEEIFSTKDFILALGLSSWPHRNGDGGILHSVAPLLLIKPKNQPY